MDTLKHHRLDESICFALSGIWQAVKSERNVKIEIGFAVSVAFAGFLFGISQTEWLALIIMIFTVISAEVLNSAIEGVCNVVRDEDHLSYEKTRVARDMAAGAVLLLAMGSVVLGLVIFLPYLLGALSANLLI